MHLITGRKHLPVIINFFKSKLLIILKLLLSFFLICQTNNESSRAIILFHRAEENDENIGLEATSINRYIETLKYFRHSTILLQSSSQDT